MLLEKVRPITNAAVKDNVVRMTRVFRCRRIAFIAGPIALALLLFSLSILMTSVGTLNSMLPGVDVGESAFASLVNETPTTAMYPSTYVVKSQRPFIIEIDYRDDWVISGFEAERRARDFLSHALPTEEVDQLFIDILSWERSGVLPRWTLNFMNSTDSPYHYVATLSVNAISGDITHYWGPPLLPQGPTNNRSSAEEATIAILSELGYQIPANSRCSAEGSSDKSYRFSFRQLAGPVLIDRDVSSIHFELECTTGGICKLTYEWVSIGEVPTDSIIVPLDPSVHKKSLMLWAFPNSTMNDLDVCQLRLCWVLDYWSTSASGLMTLDETLVADAFSGEILDRLDYFEGRIEASYWILAVSVSVISALSLAALAYLISRRAVIRTLVSSS
jgi:hypothetical protein